MLEYNFTKLDDDFITIWSKYLLWHDASDIMPDLTRLAEKGQINAIQSWYLLKNKEEKNKIIDNIVNGYSGDSFNEALAIAHRTYDKEKGKIQEIKDLVEKYCDLGDALAEQTGISAAKNEHYAKVNVLVQDYQNTKYAKQLVKAARIAELDSSSSKSVYVYERLFEIYQSNPMVLNKDRISPQTIIRARKILKGAVKKDPYDARSKFALAKNLIFFAKNEKEELEGAQILFELSKRPLNFEEDKEKGEN